MRKKVQLLSLLLASVTACSTPAINTPNTVNMNTGKSDFKVRTSISGKVEFPFSSNQPFMIKSTINDIATNATVSLIYPHDHLTYPNKTIATGLTNSLGQFLINPDTSFIPTTGSVYILEASKRIGTAGNPVITIRTFVKWNGSSWSSITTPGIYINSKTTALTIISSLNPSAITPVNTINTMQVVNNVVNVTDINTNITAVLINQAKDLVESTLQNGKDPVETLIFQNGVYSSKDNSILNFSGVSISGNLSGLYLGNVNFSDANLSNTNFTGANLLL